MKNPLIEKFGDEQRWCNWRLEERKGKKTKVPYAIDGSLGSSTDPKTWATYADARLADENVGIVFTPDRLLLGVDIDHCVEGDKIKHAKSKAIREFIKAADTYTELSPSQTGLHLYFALSAPLSLVANRHEPFECYTEGRYFTVTGVAFGINRKVRTITPQQATELLTILGYPWAKEKPAPPTEDEEQAPHIEVGDDELLAKMFGASNGPEIKKLFDGDTTQYAKDASRADMALLSHLAFWTQKSAPQMERLWLQSELGHRAKTRGREDYRTRTIANAISLCREVYKPELRGLSSVKIGDPRLNLLYAVVQTKEGKHKSYYKNTENMFRILAKHPEYEGTLRFDEYKNIVERKFKGEWRNLKDSDIIDIQTRISMLFSEFSNIKKDMVFDAIIKCAYEHPIDSGADYLRSLTWDKTHRLDNWLSHTFHTPEDEYHQKIGSNWLKGLVRRIIIPGSKFDYVLVLEGAQGIRKSTSLMVLAGSLGHIETTMSTDTKDFFMQFLGNGIVEFSEGETLSRTEVKKMKALITVQTDKFREPYGKAVVEHPRRCVFAMTTNQTEYLKDETGNRRWLPVAVNGMADIEWLMQNREQLLAEAYHRAMNLKETTWEFPEEEMERQQNLRRIQDPNADPIVNWYATLSRSGREEGITIDQAFRYALNAGFSGPMTRPIEMGVADVLKTVLMLEKKRGMVGGIRTTRWYPTKQTEETIPVLEALAKLDNF